MSELPPQPESQNEDPFIEDARRKVGKYFDKQTDPDERIGVILRSVEPFVETMPEEKAHDVIAKIRGMRDITDREEFVAKYLDANAEIFGLRHSDPLKFEQLMREAALRSGKREAASDLVNYKIKGDQANIHLYDTNDLEPYKSAKGVQKALLLRRDFEKALGHFVRIFSKNEDLKNIHAVSYLIAENPKLFSEYGFEVNPENLSEEEKLLQFGESKRDVRVANLSRETLLRMYDENGKRKEKTA